MMDDRWAISDYWHNDFQEYLRYRSNLKQNGGMVQSRGIYSPRLNFAYLRSIYSFESLLELLCAALLRESRLVKSSTSGTQPNARPLRDVEA